MNIVGYGIQLSEEDIKRHKENLYKYLEAIIKAEQLNPETDWESIRQTALLRQIAESDLPYFDRRKLVHMLLGNEEN